MSIEKQIEETIIKTLSNDLEGALIAVFIAIDATSKNEFPELKNRNSERFKKFLNDNMSFITFIMYGNFISKLTLPNCYKGIDGLEKFKNNEYISLVDIIYHVIRCKLIHEADLPISIQFTDQPIIECTYEKAIISKFLIDGLLLSVVCSKTNESKRINGKIIFSIQNHSFDLNSIWGKKEFIMKVFQ